MRPSDVRPPSGKITRGMPPLRVLNADRILATERAGCCWSTHTWPERFKWPPTIGYDSNSFLNTIRNSNGRYAYSTGISNAEPWFTAYTCGFVGSIFSRLMMRIGQEIV